MSIPSERRAGFASFVALAPVARWLAASAILGLPSESAAAQELDPPRSLPTPDSGLPLAGYDGGYFLQTPDGAFRLTLEGLLQFQARAYEAGLGRTSGFDLERMRLEFSGEFERLWLFHIEPNFSEADVELEEAWLGADLALGGPRLMLGRMKEPFGLEEMLPRKGLDFATFSILNQFSPAEDHGATLLGGGFDRRYEYGLAVYNGTGGDDSNSDKDVAARGVIRPFDSHSSLRGLQFGAAVTHGREDHDVSGDELRTEARVPFLTFEPGSMLDGERMRAGLEAAWLHGPLAVFAEGMMVTQDMEGAAGEAEVRFEGWYVGASWVLTGEEKTFRGVHPSSPLRRNATDLSGCGAWQVAARFSRLGLDDDLVSTGIVAPTAFPDDVSTIDIGLNWYATYHARVKLHFLHTDYGERITVDGESRGSEDAALLQFQFHF